MSCVILNGLANPGQVAVPNRFLQEMWHTKTEKQNQRIIENALCFFHQ